MKTIQLFLIAIFFISFTNTKAQEKQNDATWEETIKFINNNKINIVGNACCVGKYETKLFNIVDHIITLETKNAKYGYFLNPKADLTFLKKAQFYTYSAGRYKYVLQLDFMDELVIIDTDRGSSTSAYLKFEISSELMGKKLEKAFQHLAYLATEKRKESKF